MPQLSATGLDIVHAPFFTDAYLTRLYSNRNTRLEAIQAYGRRLRQLRNARNSDLIWIEKEVFPWLPWLAEKFFLPGDVRFIVDYDDAVFHRYDLHRLHLVRRLLGNKLDHLMASATVVTAGNTYLADRARNAGATRVEIIPTVVDMDQYAVREFNDSTSPPRIGWIGSPSTWQEYMVPMLPLLTDVAKFADARIVAVGAGQTRHSLVDILPWSEESEVAQIQSMDIGIMPLTNTPWSRGKCGYKLIQYMACGLPVIASPVGVNTEIIDHGVNGFLASSEREWRDALIVLTKNPKLREKMGRAGRKKVETAYSLQTWGPCLATMMVDLTNQRRV